MTTGYFFLWPGFGAVIDPDEDEDMHPCSRATAFERLAKSDPAHDWTLWFHRGSESILVAVKTREVGSLAPRIILINVGHYNGPENN